MSDINLLVMEDFDQAIKNVTPNTSSGISTIDRKFRSIDRGSIGSKSKSNNSKPTSVSGTTVATPNAIQHKPKPAFGLGSGKSLNGW